MRRAIQVCIVLSLILGLYSEECQIKYFHHPPSVLDCNPYGSHLQLHCAAAGPSSADFNVTWYLSTEEGTRRLSSGGGFSIQNVELIVEDERTSSSTLVTTSVREADTGLCYWCEIEEVQDSVRSNALCILSAVEYTNMTNCSETGLLANNTEVCAGALVAGRDSSNSTSATVLPPITPTLTESLPSMATSVYSTVISTPSTNSNTASSNGSSNGGDEDDGLYGAIASCVVFVVVIVVLTAIIVILCKRKSRGNAVSHTVKLMTDNHTRNGNRIMRNAFSEPPDIQPLPEKGVTSSRLDTGRALSEPDFKILGHDDLCDYDHLQPINTKERFYYTLEDTEKSISPRSTSEGQPISLKSCHVNHDNSNGKKPTEDFADYDEISSPPCSLSLAELFDDPKYASLFVTEPKKRTNKPRRTQSSSPVHSMRRNYTGNHSTSSGARSQQELSTLGEDEQGTRDQVVVTIEVHEVL